MGARKLKNGAGDGANIHVFNIKPCVFPAKFRTPFCQIALRACRLGTKPLAYRVFLFPASPPPGTKQSTQLPTPGLCWVTLPGGCSGGMVTAGIEPYIMSNITVIKVSLHHRNNRHRMRAPISCKSKNCRHKMADL